MTLPSSGTIKASDINLELGRPADASFDIGGATERALARVYSGTISLSNFYGKGRPTIQFLNSVSTSSDSQTYQITPANVGNIGADDPTREILLVILPTGGGNLNVTNVQIGSPATITGTICSNNATFGGAGRQIWCARLLVPTGSTISANIFITLGSSISGTFRCGLWKVTNRNNRGSLTDQAHQFELDSGSAGGYITGPMAINNGGFAIGGMYCESGNAQTISAGGAGWVLDGQESQEGHNSSFFHTPIQTSAVTSQPTITFGGSTSNVFFATWAFN